VILVVLRVSNDVVLLRETLQSYKISSPIQFLFNRCRQNFLSEPPKQAVPNSTTLLSVNDSHTAKLVLAPISKSISIRYKRSYREDELTRVGELQCKTSSFGVTPPVTARTTDAEERAAVLLCM